MTKKHLTPAVINAGLTALYIYVVSTFMMYAESLHIPDSPLAGMIFLLLFVVSAATTGSLVFGTPILWYLDGKKRDALLLLGATLGTLALILVAAILVSIA